MKNDVMLVQYASGPHVPMLEASMPIHTAYCEARGIQFKTVTEPKNVRPWWQKYVVGLAEMSELADGAIVLMMDPDTLIVGDEHIADAMRDDADFCAVRNTFGHFNCGAVWVRNSAAVRAFLTQAIALGDPLAGISQQDQQRINLMLPRSGLKIATINRRWNDYDGALGKAAEPTQIRAWHGKLMPAEKLFRMRKEIDARD